MKNELIENLKKIDIDELHDEFEIVLRDFCTNHFWRGYIQRYFDEQGNIFTNNEDLLEEVIDFIRKLNFD